MEIFVNIILGDICLLVITIGIIETIENFRKTKNKQKKNKPTWRNWLRRTRLRI